VETAKVLCGEVKPISPGGLKLPATHVASINHINALRILKFILRKNNVLTSINLSFYTIRTFALASVCSPNDPWFFAATYPHAFYQSVYLELTTALCNGAKHWGSGSQTCSSRYPNQGSDYVLLPSLFRSNRS